MKLPIIEKLQKLIAHEESARKIGNTNEALAFAQKIQELLDKHNLSISDIPADKAAPHVASDIWVSLFREYWQKILLNKIAKLNTCRVVLCSKGCILIGAEQDRQIVITLYDYFEQLGRHLSDISIRDFQRSREYLRQRKKSMHTRAWRSNFCIGYVAALVHRLTASHNDAVAAANNETAMIFIGNKLRAVETALGEIQTRPNRQKKKVSKNHIGGFLEGVIAGKSVALTSKTIEN